MPADLVTATTGATSRPTWPGWREGPGPGRRPGCSHRSAGSQERECGGRRGKLSDPGRSSGRSLSSSARRRARLGPVTIEMPNQSPIQHNTRSPGPFSGKVPVGAKGGTSSSRWPLKPGTVHLSCAMPVHAAGGMSRHAHRQVGRCGWLITSRCSSTPSPTRGPAATSGRAGRPPAAPRARPPPWAISARRGLSGVDTALMVAVGAPGTPVAEVERGGSRPPDVAHLRQHAQQLSAWPRPHLRVVAEPARRSIAQFQLAGIAHSVGVPFRKAPPPRDGP